MNRTPEEIINLRPLVFLCGPLYDPADKKDRRKILRQYLTGFKTTLSYNGKDYVIEPFALIIDNVFNTEDLEKHQNIALIEEVIAACAYKNYIFIDTMSTALELGLFANSYSQNRTTALLPKDYRLFKPAIGYFVEQTIKKSDNITLCIYGNKRINKFIDGGKRVIENLVAFKSNQIPGEIERDIKKDFSKGIESFILRIEFTTDIKDTEKILYQVSANGIGMVIPPRILFYLVETFGSINDIKNALLDYFEYYECEKNKELVIMSILIRKELCTLDLASPFEYSIIDVIGSMSYFIEKLKTRAAFHQNYERLRYAPIKRWRARKRFSAYELFGMDIMEMRQMQSLFGYNKKKSVISKNLLINGKKRKIKMYSCTSEGFALRSFHLKLMKQLQKLIELQPYSYAYRKDRSIFMCMNQHIDSKFFLKIDIKDFFNSISKGKMNKILKCHLCYDSKQAYEDNVIRRRSRYLGEYVKEWLGIKEITDICFVNGRLALGMVTSPILSNIYMDFFDERFHDNYPGLIYTRYSDDILISSGKWFDYKSILNFIAKELCYLELEMNEHKVGFYKLKQAGDHIKFLGLNIVQGQEENYITVGKQYIKDVCSNISQYEKKIGLLKKSQIIGQIEYIKFISDRDYLQLQKIYRIKNHKDLKVEELKRVEV